MRHMWRLKADLTPYLNRFRLSAASPSAWRGGVIFVSILLVSLIALTSQRFFSDWNDGVVLVPTREATARVDLIFPQHMHPTGLAHYTEHLAWLSAIDGPRDADRHSNAWTNNYAIGYWLSGAPEDLSDSFSKLKRVFDPLSVRQDFAEQERDIVLREYDLYMAGNAVAQAGEALNAFLYAENAIAASVIGTPEQIAGFTFMQAKAFHAETHRPESAILVVTGNISDRQLRRALKQAEWPPATPRDELLQPPPFDLAEAQTERFDFVDRNAVPRLIWRRVVALPAPLQFDLLEVETTLLRDILDTSLPGGIAGPLRFDAALARSFDISIWPIDEENIEIEFVGIPDSGVTLAVLQDAFEQSLTETAQAGIPAATYERVLNRFEGFWPDWSNSDVTDEWMAAYIADRISILREPLSRRAMTRLARGLSHETTNTLLRHLADDKGRTAIAYIGPKESFE